ncbi:MAG: hypothetical protein JXA74_17965 [Anaerolineae bacterium]|nr:hypothetical protein [Anaerolineae bacterium]
MKIRKACALARMYADPKRVILCNSPELIFIHALCAHRVEEAVALFRERKLFGTLPPVVDLPYGRFEGLEGIRDVAENWLPTFHAQSASVRPIIQTRAGGRSVTELVVDFVVDGEIEQVPMFVVGDLRTQSTLDEIRVYCHFSYVPGLTPYRRPMFRSAHLEMGDPGLLTGAVREYYEALHHVPKVDVERILGAMGEGCQFGGYGPGDAAAGETTRQELRRHYERMASYIPRCVGMRYETIIDDGVTGIIEWVHIVSEAGQKELYRSANSGIAAYERGEDGLLCAIRICDYAGHEREIDWTKTPISKAEADAINLVKAFPAGVGRKQQS